ncbi:RAMP superfamily CRISPR-associated protein [Fusobacterium polymorphum]|jgi:hypothetical protein|uniref:RAMP superfamily CRISPR-associated protein n=1 Tax=Fusobacterium nucleatum subsp. polymorphum TaxID=76857 RepID=UPI001C6E6C1D|nr:MULTISPECIES: RAMP superfamily CRISPR-associated protein [Fusobacterium]QYR60769.1 hypothetical protein JY402_09240 [Fusobacterium polymorphum]WCB31508.1 RAMP superfamily CRISPR-associated protein [Fusobacterium nucleatum]
MKEEKKIEEFLKLENRLTLKLIIKPLSPLCIKLSCDNEENLKSTGNYLGLLTTEQGELVVKEGEVKKDNRRGEIYIPGSTLKGLFRDRFLTMYDDKIDYIKKLFGNVENTKDGNEIAKKSRFFIQDSFFCNKKNREEFYDNVKLETLNNKNVVIDKFTEYRSITPIDHFTSQAVTPLKFEYTMENFSTELIIDNAKLQDLQGIYFVIRDSWNQEIRIGNSKTRGFGLIKFEIEDLIYEQFKRKDDNLKVLEDFFEEKDNKGEEKLIKFDFSKKLYLKKEFKELYKEDKTPNKFIISLFKGGEN